MRYVHEMVDGYLNMLCEMTAEWGFILFFVVCGDWNVDVYTYIQTDRQ